MTGEPKNTSNLAVSNTVSSLDRIVFLKDPTGTPRTMLLPVTTLSANMVFSNSAPTSNSSNGTPGTIRWDTDYIYVCVASNQWKRAALASW